jgi:hypothetical protein
VPLEWSNYGLLLGSSGVASWVVNSLKMIVKILTHMVYTWWCWHIYKGEEVGVETDQLNEETGAGQVTMSDQTLASRAPLRSVSGCYSGAASVKWLDARPGLTCELGHLLEAHGRKRPEVGSSLCYIRLSLWRVSSGTVGAWADIGLCPVTYDRTVGHAKPSPGALCCWWDAAQCASGHLREARPIMVEGAVRSSHCR